MLAARLGEMTGINENSPEAGPGQNLLVGSPTETVPYTNWCELKPLLPRRHTQTRLTDTCPPFNALQNTQNWMSLNTLLVITPLCHHLLVRTLNSHCRVIVPHPTAGKAQPRCQRGGFD